MRPGRRHPILALRRVDTVTVCAALGLDAVHDPSNVDPAFVRNRVRHELLPLMADIAGRDLVPVLVRQTDVLRAVGDHLRDEAAEVDPTDAFALRCAPAPVAIEALRRWLRAASAEGHPPDAATVQRVMAVAGGEIRATDVGGGWRVARTEGRLRLEAPRGTGGV